MLSSSSTHRIQNFKKRQICLSLYLSTQLRLHPLPLLAFSIIFAFIQRSHAKRLALMEKIQNHGCPIPCVVPPRKFRNREVRSTGASSPRQRQATVIFSFNILSRRRSSGERRRWLSNSTSLLRLRRDGRLLGWRMGNPGLSVAEELNYS